MSNTKKKAPELSNWISVNDRLPTIEGVYETNDIDNVVGYQRYKNGFWGQYTNKLEFTLQDPHEHETIFPPTHWRGILEEQENT